jgi:2-phosphoglycerate kinase
MESNQLGQKIMNKNIILIGGAPTTGKSTMAHLVAKHLGVPWISTDQIREIMRLVANRKDYPKLFNPEGYTAERFLTEFSAEQIANMEMEQGEAVWPGIKKFIEDDYTWKDGFVIEGVNLLPHLIAKDFANEKQIKPIFLVDEDADRIRNVVFTRGLWDDAHTYSDDVKEKEIEWTLLFSHKLKTEVEKYGYPWIEVKKQEDDLQAVLKALGV